MKNNVHAALLAGATLWCLSIVAAPAANLTWVYEFFSIICHQDPGRSWSISGHSFPVCIRCASIYFGFLASLWLGLPGKLTWLRASIALILAEFVIARLVIDTAVLRCLSGLLLGATAAPFVRQGLEELIRDRKVPGGSGAGM